MQIAFPVPEDDDAEDVAWGLTTGAALWRQGERYDAIVWLKRAVEAANEAGASLRADQLNRAATDLIASLAAVPPQLAPLTAPKIPLSPPKGSPSAPRFPETTPGFPAAEATALESMSNAVAAPPAPRPGPAPPRPPPAPRAPSPPAMRRAAPTPPKPPPPPPRAAMSSVATSAPPIDVLTAHHAPSDEPAREPPPPPTIEPNAGPDVPADLPTPNIRVEMLQDPTPVIGAVVDEPTPVMLAAVVELQTHQPVEAPVEANEPEPASPADSIEPDVPSSPILLAALDGLPLTADQKRALSKIATIETLSSEEDVSVPYLALVVEGRASAQATVADVNAVTLDAGEVLFAKSSIADTLSLRLVADSEPTIIALWDHRADQVLDELPEWVEQIKRASDRVQAIAGSCMGPVGERLDDALRMQAIEKLDVRVLAPNEVIAARGEPVPGMVIVGVGTVELEGDNGDGERLGPGDFLFASEVLSGGAAPTTARAGAKGAIVLFGQRAVAHELLVTCPPLLEVLAGM